jgi:DMSO/TMAO reductase YedYZ molybdopterin-dependent catalytic subunit
MRIRASLSTLFLLAIAIYGVSNAKARQASSSAGDVVLTVRGDVERPLRLSAAELAKLPRESVEARDHANKVSTYEGTPLIEVLKLASLTFGETLKGKRLATYLLVEAKDGYRAVFALPELDPAFTDKQIILADHRDGKPLSAEEGPLRIVVPDEKRQGRWVRQVTLVIASAPVENK